MTFLQGLHGGVALALLCSLLFTEEAGVPLPFAPGELTCLAAGLLIASGGLDPYLFVPVAFAACVAGTLVGYSWARLVGEHGLTELAARLHQTARLTRASNRVRGAGIPGLALSRLVPGMRIYTTLLAGALGVDRRTFLFAVLPAIAVWEIAFVVLGAVVGVPIEHFLGRLERLTVQGIILIVIGVGGYLVIRRAPDAGGGPLIRVPAGIRIALALTIDIGVVASIVAGILAVARRLTGIDLLASWADGLVIVSVIAVCYLVVTRSGVGATIGESLLRSQYLPRGATAGGGRGAAGVQPAAPAARPPDLRATLAIMRALGDGTRLELLRALLVGEQTTAGLAAASGVGPLEVVYQLGQLTLAGLVVTVPATVPRRYTVAEPARTLVVEIFALPAPPGGGPPLDPDPDGGPHRAGAAAPAERRPAPGSPPR